MHYHTTVGKRFSNPEDKQIQISFFLPRAGIFTVTVTLKIATMTFSSMLKLMTMHHHTNTGCTHFGSSETLTGQHMDMQTR